MKYFLTSILSVMFLALSAQNSPSALEKVEAAKIALITERLDLSPEQAEKFWPIYREFSDKQRTLRTEFREIRSGHDPKKASDEENRRMLEKGMQIKQRQVDLERSYADRMQQVITSRQMMSLKKAEDDFRQLLMQRVREQKSNQENMKQNRMRNNDNMQRKRNN